MHAVAQTKIGLIASDGVEQFLAALPAAAALLETHPEAKLHMLVHPHALGLAAFIDPRISLESDRSSAAFLALEYDLLVNLSASKAAAETAARAKAQKTAGATHERGERRITDEWSIYLHQIADKNCVNPIPRAELYKLICGVFSVDGSVVWNVSAEDAEQLSARLIPEPHQRILLNVSTLSTKLAAALVSQLLEKNADARVYLTGTLQDRSISSNILDLMAEELRHRCWDLTGGTSVRDLAVLAQLADLVICNPGLLSHFASLSGTLTIHLTSGPQAVSRLPYAGGHIVFVDKSRTTADTNLLLESLADAACYALGGGGNPPGDKEWAFFFEEKIDACLNAYEAYTTQIHSHAATSESPAHTSLFLLPLLYQGADSSQAIHSIYRLLWLYDIAKVDARAYELEILHSTTIDGMRSLLPSLEGLAQLASFGQKYSEYVADNLLKGALDKARMDGERLSETDRMIATLAMHTPELAPLVNFFSGMQDILETSDPIAAAHAMAALYKRLQQQVLIFLDLIQGIFHQHAQPTEQVTYGQLDHQR